MGDAKSIGQIGLGGTAAGGLLSAFGSLMQGSSNKNMYDYQAGVARLNQQIANQNAEFAIQTGEQDATKFGLKAGERMGQIKTTQAASGLDVRSGSAVQVRQSQATLDQMDLDTIRSNAAKTAYNYKVQGTMAGAQAELYSQAGKNSVVAGGIGAASSILGSAASVSSEWLQGQRVGLWGGGGSSPVSGVIPTFGGS